MPLDESDAARARERGTQLPLAIAVRTDGTLDFAAVTHRARMMGATRVPGVGVGV
eukprot:COSAG06_NODE_47496_length_338_cov_4.351464_1_plen_54_part_10